MRYYYKVENKRATKGVKYKCDHPLYNSCTLYLRGGLGLAVIQERFNSRLKSFWYGPIDEGLVDDIYNQPGFDLYFAEHAQAEHDGLYPTVSVRKIMWALRMKPLPAEEWNSYKKHIL